MEKRIAAALSALKDSRSKLSRFRCADSTMRKRLPSEQAINDLLRSNFTKAGFEIDKFDELIKQNDTEVRQQLENLKAEDDKQAPAVLNTLLHGIDNAAIRVSNLRALAPLDNYFVLGTADAISSNSDHVTLVNTHIGWFPNDPNSAQFSLAVEAHSSFSSGFSVGVESVGFFFSWQNPSESIKAVDVAGLFGLAGVCSVFSDGGFLVIGNSALLSVDASLQIHELWNHPPTSPVSQSAQSQNALDIECDTLGVLQQAHVAGQSVAKSFELRYSQLLVPPKGIALFEVACELHYALTGDSSASAWFRGNGRELVCPWVTITVLP